MDTALLREHCFEAEERSHDYHTSCERRAAGKGTHHVCGPAPGELVDHFCHRAIDLYHDPLARVGACRALPLACAPVLVITSKYDGLVDSSHAVYVEKHIPQAQLFISEAESHLMWFSIHNHEIQARMQVFLHS